MNKTMASELAWNDYFIVENFKGNYYGSLEGAMAYFNNVLHGELWIITPNDKQKKALTSATQHIDQLSFIGYESESNQILAWPRKHKIYSRTTDTFIITDLGTPNDIIFATYELALALLRGVNVETEQANLFVRSQVMGPLRTDYTGGTPEQVVAGIPCYRAWLLLKPYMTDVHSIRTCRV
jgi:hypothetical protein